MILQREVNRLICVPVSFKVDREKRSYICEGSPLAAPSERSPDKMNKYFVQETKCYSTEPLWNGKQMQVYFYLLSPADPGVERCDLP